MRVNIKYGNHTRDITADNIPTLRGNLTFRDRILFDILR